MQVEKHTLKNKYQNKNLNQVTQKKTQIHSMYILTIDSKNRKLKIVILKCEYDLRKHVPVDCC